MKFLEVPFIKSRQILNMYYTNPRSSWLSLLQILRICRSSNFLYIDLKDTWIWLEFCFSKIVLFSGAPWLSKSTHPRKFGYRVTVHRTNVRPSVRTTGIPMFTLALSSWFGSPGENWLHISVVINWQLSKQSIRWPVSPDRIAGLRCRPIEVEYFFWSYPLTCY